MLFCFSQCCKFCLPSLVLFYNLDVFFAFSYFCCCFPLTFCDCCRLRQGRQGWASPRVPVQPDTSHKPPPSGGDTELSCESCLFLEKIFCGLLIQVTCSQAALQSDALKGIFPIYPIWKNNLANKFREEIHVEKPTKTWPVCVCVWPLPRFFWWIWRWSIPKTL